MQHVIHSVLISKDSSKPNGLYILTPWWQPMNTSPAISQTVCIKSSWKHRDCLTLFVFSTAKFDELICGSIISVGKRHCPNKGEDRPPSTLTKTRERRRGMRHLFFFFFFELFCILGECHLHPHSFFSRKGKEKRKSQDKSTFDKKQNPNLTHKNLSKLQVVCYTVNNVVSFR